MLLPGGICGQEGRRRDFAFKPMTGAVELALTEIAGERRNLPSRVTAALGATLAHVGGLQPTTQVISGLCVADRQYLMRRLYALLGEREHWFTVCCGACGEQFDFAVSHADLPVKEAGDGFPFAVAETSQGTCRVRVPTGADQECITGIENDAEALKVVVGRCLVGSPQGNQKMPDPGKFADGDIDLIEAALERVAPEVTTIACAACAACGKEHVVDVDPYIALANRREGDLLQEIHRLASAYHWSESEILSLPLARRRKYLEWIDRARSLTT